jgi:hypothetical protein
MTVILDRPLGMLDIVLLGLVALIAVLSRP